MNLGGFTIDYDYNELFDYQSPKNITFILNNFESKKEAKNFLNNIKFKNHNEYEDDCDINYFVRKYFERFDESIFKLFYGNIFSSEYLEYPEPQYESEYYFSLNFLKVLDSALKFSKKDNGENEYIKIEEFGVHNTSEWNLETLINEYLIFEDISDVNNSLSLKLKEYVTEFSDPIPEIFENFKFFEIIDFLKKNNLLYFYIIWLYVLDLNEVVFRSSKNLQDFYMGFLDEVRKKPFYKFSSTNPINPHPIRYTIEKSILPIKLLPKILFSRIDLKHTNEISILDPMCGCGDLLLECYKFIKKINPDCKIDLYGNILNKDRTSALCLSQMLFLKKDTGNFVFVNEPSSIFSIDNFQQKQFDFIISDFSFLENQDPNIIDYGINPFKNLCEKCNGKIVLLNSSRFYNNIIRYFIDHKFYSNADETVQRDVLEAIIRLPIIPELKKDYIFVFNFNKTIKTKGKFLLIDEFQDSAIYHSNKMPNKILKRILKFYNRFMGYEKGELIFNSQVKETLSIPHLMFEKKFSLENLGVPTYYLKQLADLNFGKTEDIQHYDFFFPAFDNDFISPYIMDKPLPISRSEWNKKVYYTSDFFDEYNGIKIYSMVFKIKSSLVLKEYLYHFLNSNKGKFIISFFTRDWVNINDFFYLPIPVPSIDEQEKIIEVARNMEEFFTTMDIWKNDYSNNILDYMPASESYKNFTCAIEFNENGRVKEFCKNWRIVYQGLAWPLAYSYLKATKGSRDDGIKKDNYIILFEFLAAFNVTVLISGIKNFLEDEGKYDEIMDQLWQLYRGDKRTWHTMYFGRWTALYGYLTEIYDKYDISNEFDNDFLFELSKNKFKKLFNRLREKERNSNAHRGLEDDFDVNIKMRELEDYMGNEIFDILKIYSGFKFYYVNSRSENISPKLTSYEVWSLNGPCDFPHPHDLVTDKELEYHNLYFYNPLNDTFLKLDNDLMKFRIIPDKKQYGIYIYDKIDVGRNVAKYKAFHLKDEVWEIPLKTDEDTYFKVSDEFLKEVLRLDNM